METKHAADKAALIYAKNFGFRVLNLGMTVVYGPRQGWETEKAVPTFFLRALQKLPLEVYGDGLSTVNMMFVKDVAALIVDLSLNGQVFQDGVREMHLANPHGDISVIELVTMVNALACNESGFTNVDMRMGQPEAADPARYDLGSVKHYIPDYDERLTALSEGLLRAMHYYEGKL